MNAASPDLSIAVTASDMSKHAKCTSAPTSLIALLAASQTCGPAARIPSIDGILAAGPHVCDAANKAIKDVGADVHLACFDMSDAVTAMLRSGDASFTIDQQQRLQGYMPIIVLHLYNTNAGMLPGANIPSGPGFVDASNIDNVASQAGVNR